MVKVKEDLTGMKFGKLTVIKQVDDYIESNGQHHANWLCLCDCGNNKIVLGKNLKNNNTKSCGCMMIEKSKETILKYNTTKFNTYDLSDKYGIGYTTNGEEFWFDLEDYNKIKDYCWWFNSDGYIVSKDTERKKVSMHRIVTDCPDGLEPDHIHGYETRYDNRKSNLRIVEHQKNMMNKKRYTNNTSGVTGVYLHKPTNKWKAEITKNNKRINLGCFNNFEDAVKVRKEAEEKYFGEYSYDYSMKEGVV